MSKATDTLNALGKDVILFCQSGPNAHCVMHEGAWIAFSGIQKVADLNIIGITASASKNMFDAILFIAADAVNAIQWATEKGLIGAGQAPFMQKTMTTAAVINNHQVKAQLCDKREVILDNGMAEKAFDFPKDSVQQAIPSKTYTDPAVDLWMAKTPDNQLLGCGTFISDVDGERIGIYAMATPPNKQRLRLAY